MSSIKSDHQRFKQIVRGQIKENLQKHISKEEMIGKQENEYVKIPIHKIDIPHFKFGNMEEGVGMGEGQEGGEGQEAGNEAGQHSLVEFSIQELTDILGEKLNLPRIEPKGSANQAIVEGYKYTSRSNQGPEGLKHFKSTYKKALKRLLSTGQYNPHDPIVVPIKADKIYKSFKPLFKPQAQAVIFYLMDVSGSMGHEQKDVVKIETFWINAWLKKHYPKLDTRFIVHDAKAQEVDEKTFFNIQESGGTLISSAYELCQKIIQNEYPINDWNIYILHFSDGDNWNAEDTHKCIKLIQNQLLPIVNLFGYGQVNSRHGSGQFYIDLEKGLTKNEKTVLSQINGREDILKSIKEFLGNGK